MRTLSGALTTAQQASSSKPYVTLTFTRSGDATYTYKTTDGTVRILYVEQDETPYRGQAIVRIINDDQYFNNIDLRGYRLDIGWGHELTGDDETSPSPPLWVEFQRYVSSEGILACELQCFDSWEMLNRHKVMGQSLAQPPYWNADTSIKDIINSLVTGVGLSFNDGTGGADSLIDNTPVYETEVNQPVRNVIRDLLIRTKSGLIYDSANNRMSLVHIPTSAATVYTYDTDHAFFSSAKQAAHVIPNRVVVVSAMPTSVIDVPDIVYSGSYEDNDSYAAYDNTYYTISILDENVQSDAECVQLAEAYLHRLKTEINQGVIEVPMNCGQELLDFIEVIDSRLGSSVYGRVGSLKRVHDPRKGIYRLTITLGGATSPDMSSQNPFDDLTGLNLLTQPISGRAIGGNLPIPSLGMGAQSYYASITFSPGRLNGQDRHSAVHWTSGNIQFADSSYIAISSGEITNISNGQLVYIYANLDATDTAILEHGNLNDAIGARKLILAVVTGQASGTDIGIRPIRSHGLRVVTDWLADEAISEARLFGVGVITTTAISNDAITTPKLFANAVTAAKINVVGLDGASGRILVVDDATDANKLTSAINSRATTLITAGKIVISGAQTLSNWRHGSDATLIDGGKIYTHSISADKISVGSLSALSANLGHVTAGTIESVNLYSCNLTGGIVEATTLTASYIRSYGLLNVDLISAFSGSLRLMAPGYVDLIPGSGFDIMAYKTILPIQSDLHSLGRSDLRWWDVHVTNLYDYSPKKPHNIDVTDAVSHISVNPEGKYDYSTLPDFVRAKDKDNRILDGTNIGALLMLTTLAVSDVIRDLAAIESRLLKAGI